jgi:hypothetical protein
MKGGNGLGIFGTTQLIFIILKLTGNIDWSWGAVLSPIIVIATLLAMGIVTYVIVFSYLTSKGWSMEDINKRFGLKNEDGDGV